MQRWLVNVRKLVSPSATYGRDLAGMVELPGRTPARSLPARPLRPRIRISDLIDSYRDLLSSAMAAYLSMVSNKLNEVMKQLTIIATVFLPLSFLTGFFGQNFGWLVVTWAAAHLRLVGIGTEVLAVGLLYWLFRRRGWIGAGS